MMIQKAAISCSQQFISNWQILFLAAYVFFCSSAVASSAPLFRPAPTLAPLKQPIDRMKDPRLAIAKINEERKKLSALEGISEQDRNVLIQANRADHAKLRALQRQQVMKRVEELPFELNRLVASFITGGFFRPQGGEGCQCVVLDKGLYKMLLKLILSMDKAWSFCDWTQDNKHVLYIPRTSRLLSCVNVDTDKRVNCCHVPASIGKITSLDCSIAGLALVTGEDGALLWNGTHTYTFSHAGDHVNDLISLLPPYALYLKQTHDNLYAYFADNFDVPKESIKVRTIVENQNKQTYKFVLGQQRTKCAIIGKNVIQRYSAASNMLLDIDFDQSLPKAIKGDIDSVSFVEKSDDILVSSAKGSCLLRPQGNLFSAADVLTVPDDVNEYIKECYSDETGAMIAWLMKPSGATPIHLTKGDIDIAVPLLRDGRSDQIRFRGGRLISSFLPYKGKDQCPILLDIADIMYVSKDLAVAQSDFVYSLCEEHVLLQNINARLHQEKRFNIKFTRAQAAIWCTIPEKLRNRFMRSVADAMSIDVGVIPINHGKKRKK